MSFDWAPPLIGATGPELPARAPQTQPYRPDTVLDGWATDGFAVRAASVRGPGHRASDVPRQDDFALATADGSVIAVVADGVSNAPLSHLGATMVCRTVVDYLLRADDTVDWHDLLRCAGWALVEYAGRQLGEPDPQRAEALLASTVVVALVRPDGPGRAVAHLVRVGDSAAWRLRDGTWEPLLTDPTDPQDELLPDGVAALPRVPTEVDPVAVTLVAGDVLVLATDGFAEPLGHGTGDLGQLFGDGLTTPPALTRLAWMLDFAGGAWDDDRTVLAVWPVPPELP
ncbi:MULTISPECIES: protein phosphatase 2C domain-containing protein [unclassified Micromonospora]|uniref:protein phosphatase 2C domain-containing protein n=1 Tax=unclassified Micromonospora TaxID=2617518 RepID=UPI001C5FAABE|nr:protein phosphatase 2C domain-containing protein [Micromonospora sp. RL09-050-HVF-A]MBW4703775.1 protein phosphatase 2C domain-containing protein [Micromonospora sp. RL09-050-HVF-A]